MHALLTGDALVALTTLTAMEIVLGIDNVVFVAILTSRLPRPQQPLARRLGIGLALLIRIGLLFTIAWLMGLTRPFFAVGGHPFSGRDLILLGGGLFLIGKSTWKIYDKLEAEHTAEAARGGATGIPVGVDPAPRPRYRLLPRLGDHRCRHGPAGPDHGRGHGAGDARDAPLVGPDRRVRRAASAT